MRTEVDVTVWITVPEATSDDEITQAIQETLVIKIDANDYSIDDVQIMVFP